MKRMTPTTMKSEEEAEAEATEGALHLSRLPKVPSRPRLTTTQRQMKKLSRCDGRA